MPQRLHLKLALPGSKSITNRAFLCAALAKGGSRLYGALQSEDTAVMVRALRQLGLRVEEKKDHFAVHGRSGQFKRGDLTLELGNAGTAVRFLTAAMILRGGKTVITGDARMRERPIADLVTALRALGVPIAYHGKEGCPPLSISPFNLLGPKADIFDFHSREFTLTVDGRVSSQYYSALLMLGPMLHKPLRIRVQGELVSRPYIDMTLAVMKSFGVRVFNKKYREFLVKPQAYKSRDYFIEGDASAASYFSSMNFLHGGRLEFLNLDYKKSIQGDADYPRALKRLGKGAVDMNAMPDAAMTLAVTAPFVNGATVISNVGNLRVKESDRLTALRTELRKIGVFAKTTPHSISIAGKGWTPPPVTPPIATHNDHRMAMCFATLGTRVPGVVVQNPGCVNKTYPDFWKDLELAYLAPLSPGCKNLVLTGMRASGKSHLGRLIARRLRRRFVDIDHEIERRTRMPIGDIVRRHGWAYFRQIEQNICSEFSRAQNLVIATGGGAVLDPQNMRALKKNGVVIFIFADPSAAIERMKKHQHRPALKGGDPLKEFRDVWHERRSLYYKYADFVWDNTSGEVIKRHFSVLF